MLKHYFPIIPKWGAPAACREHTGRRALAVRSLHPLLAQILKSEIEPVPYLIADDPANAYPTWLG